MSAGEYARNVADLQRKRLVGSILGFAEQHMYPTMPTDVRAAFRSKVLASVGVYHDFVIDSFKATIPEDGSMNELVIEKLGQMADEIRMLRGI